ncbi:MAG TPA: 2-oxo acid dehydrogenase subunit E2 [Wenzhouxiangella sp.]
MSKTVEIRVPDIGDFVKVPVIEILASAGDQIEAEQSLITLESDKATMEVPAPFTGTLLELTVSEGDELTEGDVIGRMEIASDEDSDDSSSGEADTSTAPAAAPDVAEKSDVETSHQASAQVETFANEGGTTAQGSASSATESHTAGQVPAPAEPFAEMDVPASDLPHASPGVRKLARELGISLEGITGTGRKGRITDEDLSAAIKSQMGGGGAGLAVAAAPVGDFSSFGPVETVALSRIKKISGPALHRNWVSIPHVTQFAEADITEMEDFRQAQKDVAAQAGTKMTPVVFIIKAVVASLKAFPQFNASLTPDGGSLIHKHYFHIGVAVDTPGGLVVPVLRDCDQKGFIELAQELTELSQRARDGKLSADEMKGGCFTISSLGGIGGTEFTPIINAPELAILGVSKAQVKPIWDGEDFEPRLMLPLSLSYDHRVIDGADAARFITHLSAQLEDLRRLLM